MTKVIINILDAEDLYCKPLSGRVRNLDSRFHCNLTQDEQVELTIEACRLYAREVTKLQEVTA